MLIGMYKCYCEIDIVFYNEGLAEAFLANSPVQMAH